jgi:hypothetical protein
MSSHPTISTKKNGGKITGIKTSMGWKMEKLIKGVEKWGRIFSNEIIHISPTCSRPEQAIQP